MVFSGKVGAAEAGGRLDWVDSARGICIVLVVLMHEVVGFEVALGEASWIDPLVDWARLFRMPAFFLISGLFMSRVIDRPWPEFLDRKVAPFAYFYVVWLAINCLLKFQTWGDGGLESLVGSFLFGLIQPFGILWFIYLLPIFFVVTKLFRSQPGLLWTAAAMLALAPVATGSVAIDQFAGRYVFFLSGALFAPALFALAGWIARNRVTGALLWGAWAVASFALAQAHGSVALSSAPGAMLGLGLAGGVGVITASALIAGRLPWLDHCGRHSLPIYLAFFIPMALTRVLLIKSGAWFDIGWTALALTPVSILFCLSLRRAVGGTPLKLLFERPKRRAEQPGAASRLA